MSHPSPFTEVPPYNLNEAMQDNLDHLLGMVAAADVFAVISFRTGPAAASSPFTWRMSVTGSTSHISTMEFMADQMALFEQRGLNHALWLWEVSWEEYAQEVHAFNFRYGPDPANRSDVEDSELIRAIGAAWARNTVRPSSETTKVYLPLVGVSRK